MLLGLKGNTGGGKIFALFVILFLGGAVAGYFFYYLPGLEAKELRAKKAVKKTEVKIEEKTTEEIKPPKKTAAEIKRDQLTAEGYKLLQQARGTIKGITPDKPEFAVASQKALKLLEEAKKKYKEAEKLGSEVDSKITEINRLHFQIMKMQEIPR